MIALDVAPPSLDLRRVGSTDIDQVLVTLTPQRMQPWAQQGTQQSQEQLIVLYLWGENCFNCNQFKHAALSQLSMLQQLPLIWLHGNVYEDSALGQRFGLHGVPCFLFFNRGKKPGRISGFPGVQAFIAIVNDLQQKIQTVQD